MSQEAKASILVAFKDAVENYFREFLPAGPDGVCHVSTHVGEFGEAEVKRYLTKAPAIVLAPLNIPDIGRLGGAVGFKVQYAAFVVVRHGRGGVDRNDAALAILEEIGKRFPYMRIDCAQAPTDIDAGNLNHKHSCT